MLPRRHPKGRPISTSTEFGRWAAAHALGYATLAPVLSERLGRRVSPQALHAWDVGRRPAPLDVRGLIAELSDGEVSIDTWPRLA